MAFNTLTELNLYSQGTLAFTNDVVTTIPEGTKVALPQPTWAWVRTTGNVLGNNLTFTHETIDTLGGNVTISFDDYNAATMNTNITTANGNVSITTLNDAEDWVGATLWLDVPADYYGNISFVSTITNTDSNVSLQWNQTVVWENTPELDTPDNIQYNWYDNYAGQWSIDFWVYNDTTAPTSSSISSYPVTMIPAGGGTSVTANNWNEVLSYYDQDYIYEGFDQVIFDTRMVTASQYDGDSDGHPYFVMNNGPEFTVSSDGSTDSGVSYRLLNDDSNTLETTVILRAGPGGGDPMPRGQWTHILMSFDPNLITEAPMNGGLDFYRDGAWTNQAGGSFEVGPKLVLGRDGIDHDKYFEGYIEDFRIRGRTYNEYYSGRIVGETYSFTPPTTTTVASEGDVLLLNTPDDTNLTLDDNNYLDRDAVTITTKVGVSNYGNVTYKNTASIEFDGDNYIYIEDINRSLNQGDEAGGATFMSPDSVPYVRDEENAGTYTLNGQISTANLIMRVNSALSGASLDSLTGNETGNITMTGTRTDINAHLDTMYFERTGEVPTGSRTGNIVWTLTPPDSRAVTVINQQYSPIYNTNLTSQDRLIVPASGLRQINTLAYAGVDANANPVFAYTAYDEGLLGGSLSLTSHKINYSTGNITYGSVGIIDLPDEAESGGGRLHLLGPRDGLNTGNTSNDGSDFIITATQSGGGNLFQGNVTLNTNNLNLDDYSISTVADSTNDGTDYIYIAQIPQGVGNSWSEYPYTYTKYDHPVATFPRFDYTTADARQDYTTVYDLSTLNFGDNYSGNLVSPVEYYDWQPLDLWSDSEGGKLKAVQAKQVWTFDGVSADEVDMELRAFLGNQVEDDSDENTEYVTNITDVTTDTFFGLTGGNRGYRFNDTETDHYLKITNDDFYRLDIDAVTKTIDGTLVDGGDYLEFSGQKVTVTDNTLYVPQNDDFAITFQVNIQSNGPEDDAFLITNSNNTTIGADEFAITKYQDYISATNTWVAPRIRFYLEGTAYSATPSANQMIESNALSLNTWYTFTIRRQTGVITMEQNGTTISGQSIENNTNLGTSSLKSWYIGTTGGGNSANFYMRDLLWQVEGDNALRMEMDDVSFPIQTYLPNRDFLIEAFIKFYDNSADQWIISNLENPSATLTASDFRVSLDDSTGQLLLETYNGSSTGGTVTYEEWYHLAVQRTQAEWEVFLNGVRVCNLTEYNPIGSPSQTTLYWGDATNTTNRLEASIDSLRVGSGARFETDGFIPQSSGASTSPVGAYLTAFNTLYPYPSRHWDTITIPDQLTASELTSIGYEPRYGSVYTFDRTYFGDCVSAFKLVYGGSDSRAYLIYTKSTYTDATENFVQTSPQTSVGLFYRKVTINDDLTLSLGGEIEIVNAATGPTYGRVIAADSVRLGSNMFINIVIGNGLDSNISYVYALKFSYS